MIDLSIEPVMNKLFLEIIPKDFFPSEHTMSVCISCNLPGNQLICTEDCSILTAT